MNNFMVRFLYEAFFELMICAFINVTNQEVGGLVWWVTSLAVIIVSSFVLLAVFSLFCINGPYVRDTYAKGSFMASFWGPRALHQDVLRAALATEDKTVGLTKRDSTEDNVAIAKISDSNTQTMFNSNVPLNQQLCAAVDLNKKPELYEGGEEVLTTERNVQTERGMITEQNNAVEEADASLFKIRKEIQLRLKLEDLVEVSQRYETIFNGLKLNTAHSSAVTQPLAFMIRRLVYAALIVFMPHLPQVATIALLSICMFMLAFSLSEKQWKQPEIQKLAIANEVFLYVLLVLVLGSSCLTTIDSFESSILGWAMIGVVTLAIHVNLAVIMVNAWSHCKLLYVRHQNKKAHLAKKSKVAPTLELANIAKPKPVMAEIPEAIEEVSSMKEESLGIVGLPEPELLNPVETRSFKIAAPPMQQMSLAKVEPCIEEEFNDLA